jgi:hypothetical protein
MSLRSKYACFIAAGTALLLAGCNTVPAVQYTKIEKPEDAKKVADSFYLAQSEITIDKTAETKDSTKKTEEFLIVSRPLAYPAYKIGVRPDDSWRVTTKVSIVKIENTDLVASVGVETTDNTATVIGQIGGALVKVIGLVAALAPLPGECIKADGFPVKLALSAADLAGATGAKTFNFPAAGGAPAAGGCISVAVGELPKDAMPAGELPYDKTTSNYYYSACRDAVVEFTTPKKLSKKLRIADPNYVQFVQLPYKGSVTAHSECGVSVKTEATSPSSATQIIDALATQGKAIKDAIDAAKK